MQRRWAKQLRTGVRTLIGVVSIGILLVGCAGPTVSDYSERGPLLTPQDFFDGKLTAQGIIRDYSGEVIRTFEADLLGHWDANGVGTLEEEFRFDDGEVQTRTWTLTPEGDGLKATAGDVVEPGFMEWRGNAIHMNYVLRIPYGDDTLDVRMDDWMFATTADTVINQTEMSKWGFAVGELVLVIQRDTTAQ